MRKLSINEWQILLARSSFCLAAVVFPYSVAANNVALGLGILFGISSGQFWAGIRSMASSYPKLAGAMCAYLLMFPLGLVWSSDLQWGLHVLSHQWFWLALPIMCSVFSVSGKWRGRFLLALSFGLATNLLYCVAQALELVVLTTPNSGPDDATGHLGHISFGFVYGIWAAWLLYAGWATSGRRRWLMWCFAAWSWAMVFSAQGRGGYVVATVLAVAMMIRLAVEGLGPKRVMLALAGFVLLAGTVLALGPGSAEVRKTVEDAQIMRDGQYGAVDYRWAFWSGVGKGWWDNPFLGAGTGGYPDFAAAMKRRYPEFNYPEDMHVAHPHNAFLLALVRWGGTGVLVVTFLLWTVFTEGWRSDWSPPGNRIFLALVSLALAVQGLVASSLEEHASAALAVLLLGLGLSIGSRAPNGYRPARRD